MKTTPKPQNPKTPKPQNPKKRFEIKRECMGWVKLVNMMRYNGRIGAMP